MKEDPDAAAPPRKEPRFKPRIPTQRKVPKRQPKTEASESKEDVISKEIIAKLQIARAQDAFGRPAFKNEKKVAPAQVALGQGDGSKARTFGIFKPGAVGSDLQELDLSAPKPEKEYVEPWDYSNSYYPVDHPLRRPHSGNPEILDEEEFGEASLPSTDEPRVNAAAELGLMEEKEEPEMLFFQLPSNLPLWKRPAAAGDDNKAGGARVSNAPKKGCKLEDLPGGLMGKLQVYKSGIVKLKLGDAEFNVSPGAKCLFAQDVASINTKEKNCCILGELKKRAVITPDVDSLLDSIDNLDVRQTLSFNVS